MFLAFFIFEIMEVEKMRRDEYTPDVFELEEKWQKQKWKNGKGEYVASAGLWKYLAEHMGDHKLLIASDKEKNTYHNWQLQELDNAVKGKGTK